MPDLSMILFALIITYVLSRILLPVSRVLLGGLGGIVLAHPVALLASLTISDYFDGVNDGFKLTVVVVYAAAEIVWLAKDLLRRPKAGPAVQFYNTGE